MRRAFTLIELLIVVAIIGILAAIAVPNFLNAQIRAKIAKSQCGLKTYQLIQHSYLLDQGDIPGHYHGREEQCPYINLDYITEPLSDPFFNQTDGIFPYHERMLHSAYTEDWSLGEWQTVQPDFMAIWIQAGRPYILFGQGPAPITGLRDLLNWASPYESSNGLRSVGVFMILGVRGKGELQSNLYNRRCN